jgi:hypothetical protein
VLQPAASFGGRKERAGVPFAHQGTFNRRGLKKGRLEVEKGPF